jgi:Tat protein secretion system quality control protein TatD with DNase activity
MPAWIDTHCHLDAPELRADTAQLRARARSEGVAHCVLPAVEVSNFDAVQQMAHQFGDAYALGIHPLYTPRAFDGDLATLDAACSAMLRTSGWWPLARSDSICLCPAWTWRASNGSTASS